MQLFHILQLHAYHTRSNAGQNMFLIKPVVIRLPVRVQEIRKLVVHAGQNNIMPSAGKRVETTQAGHRQRGADGENGSVD